MNLRTEAKSRLRHAVDRVMLPYLAPLPPAPNDSVVEPATDSAPPEPVARPGGTPSDFFHGILHELRTIQLRHTPRGARKVLCRRASPSRPSAPSRSPS